MTKLTVFLLLILILNKIATILYIVFMSTETNLTTTTGADAIDVAIAIY